MREGYMIISYVVEKMDLLFLKEESSRDGVDWRITPPFIKESTILVQRLEEVRICL